MKKQLIIKTMSNQNIKTTKDTKVSQNNGGYVLEGEYMKGDKEVKGKLTIQAQAVAYVEELDFEISEK